MYHCSFSWYNSAFTGMVRHPTYTSATRHWFVMEFGPVHWKYLPFAIGDRAETKKE